MEEGGITRGGNAVLVQRQRTDALKDTKRLGLAPTFRPSPAGLLHFGDGFATHSLQFWLNVADLHIRLSEICEVSPRRTPWQHSSQSKTFSR